CKERDRGEAEKRCRLPPAGWRPRFIWLSRIPLQTSVRSGFRRLFGCLDLSLGQHYNRRGSLRANTFASHVEPAPWIKRCFAGDGGTWTGNDAAAALPPRGGSAVRSPASTRVGYRWGTWTTDERSTNTVALPDRPAAQGDCRDRARDSRRRQECM